MKDKWTLFSIREMGIVFYVHSTGKAFYVRSVHDIMSKMMTPPYYVRAFLGYNHGTFIRWIIGVYFLRMKWNGKRESV